MTVRLLAITLIFLAVKTDSHAASYNSVGTGSWTNPAIWTPSGGPPGPSDYAAVGFSAPDVITLTTDVQVDHFDLHNNGTLDLSGGTLTAKEIGVFGNAGSPTVKHSGGAFVTNILQMNTLGAGVQTKLTIAPSDNVLEQIIIHSQNTILTVQRDLVLENSLFLTFGATIDMGDHLLTANRLNLMGDNAYIRGSDGRIDVTYLSVSSGSFEAKAGDVADQLELGYQGRTNVTLTPTQGEGLSVEEAFSFFLDCSLNLTFDPQSAPGDWALRWANPVGGDRVAEILAYQAAGFINWNRVDDVEVVSRGDGYTYVMIPVPEPATAVMAVVGMSASVGFARQRTTRLRCLRRQ